MSTALPDADPQRPLIKVCGLTRPADADLAVQLGASLLGLNFYPRSPRYLEIDGARRIADAIAGRCPLVGVFVNRPPVEVDEIRRAVGLDLIQLHGDEADEEVHTLGARALRVFRVDGEPDPEGPGRFPDAWGFLYDVKHPDYGGTGESWNYGSLARVKAPAPIFVAGGVRPGNARAALEVSGADGIDVSSGVESAPGVKDPDLMEQLFAEVRCYG